MSYLGSFNIDDYVGIPAATHRFSTGAAYAPTSLTYSIYEEATAVGLDEDVDMTVASPFDSITGCYWVRRQLTAAAGFELGKNYLVVVKATVDGVAAITTHTFQVGAKVSVPIAAESYAADEATPTLSQFLWMIWAVLADFSVSGTTLTAKKQDGTGAMTFTLDDASNPTSRTRAT